MAKGYVSNRKEQRKKELGLQSSTKKENELKIENTQSKQSNNDRNYVSSNKTDFSNKSDFNQKSKSFSKQNNVKNFQSNRNKEKVLVKISNLPIDCIDEELKDQIHEWGEIDNISIKRYPDKIDGRVENVCAYINFYRYDHAEYFVEALDGTAFGMVIINVEILDSKS